MSVSEAAAMTRAVAIAANGPAAGPNPRVGCVLLNHDGHVVGEGWHRGAGTPHAEVAAIADAASHGHPTRGATAVVTLEPCNHTGRTGPCSAALIDAGIARVVFAVPDPGAASGGGAAALRAAGVDVAQTPDDGAAALVRHWYHAITTGRPWVTVKLAMSLDGFVAAADGTSRWITGSPAREHAHRRRAEADAIAVTTGTAVADDPELTARSAAGKLAGHQPLRVVVGHRDVPANAKLRGPGGDLLHLRTHDIATVLDALQEREVRHLIVEGGPALAAAVFAAGVADEIDAYVAPVVLGAGRSAVADFGVATLAQALRLTVVRTEQLGDDVYLNLVRDAGGAA